MKRDSKRFIFVCLKTQFKTIYNSTENKQQEKYHLTSLLLSTRRHTLRKLIIIYVNKCF